MRYTLANLNVILNLPKTIEFLKPLFFFRVMKEHFQKHTYTWDIFWLFFFLIFLLYTPDRFSLFGVNLEIESGLPFIIVLLLYFKVLFGFIIQGVLKAMLYFLISLTLLSLTGILLYLMANKFAEYIEKKNWFLRGSTLFDDIKISPIILFLFILSCGIRLYFISPGMFHHDTVKLAMAVEKTIDTGILQPTVSKNYGLVALNVIFYTIPHYLFGIKSAILTLNFTSVLFGSLAVVFAFLFADELFNKFTAIMAALIFSFNPVFLSISTYGKDHAHSIFFILLAGWCLLKALKTDKNIYKILFGLSLGFSLFIRFPNILAIIPFGLLYLFSNDSVMQKYSFKNVLLIAIPFLLFFSAVIITEHDTILGQSEANEFLSFAHFDISLVRAFLRALAIGGIFLGIYGFFRMSQEKRKESLILLSWTVIIFIFYSSFISRALRFYIELYLVVALFIGYGLFHMRKKYGLLTLFIALLVIVECFTFISPVLSYRREHAMGNDLITYMENITEKNALIIDYGDYLPYYEYTSSRDALSCPLTDDPQLFNQQMERIVAEKRPLYISQSCFAFGTDEQKKNLLKAISDHFTLKEVGSITVDDFHKSEVVFDKVTYKIFKLIPNVV